MVASAEDVGRVQSAGVVAARRVRQAFAKCGHEKDPAHEMLDDIEYTAGKVAETNPVVGACCSQYTTRQLNGLAVAAPDACRPGPHPLSLEGTELGTGVHVVWGRRYQPLRGHQP